MLTAFKISSMVASILRLRDSHASSSMRSHSCAPRTVPLPTLMPSGCVKFGTWEVHGRRSAFYRADHLNNTLTTVSSI